MKVVIDHGITGATRAVARQDAIIIVDTIRASTTYVNAFGKGVNRIVPCSSREDLTNRSKKYPDCVKSGERKCKKIEGYDFGSSPKEMSLSNLATACKIVRPALIESITSRTRFCIPT